MSNWAEWHEQYENPSSPLSQRLGVVQQQIRTYLDAAPAGPIRLISACAGKGLDVVGALEGHPRRADVTGLLVEWDARLSATSQRLLDEAGLSGIRAVRGDAGRTGVYADGVPVNLLLLCGIFGNVSTDDIAATIDQASMLCAPGATVVWTRHRKEPDLTPTIRGLFAGGGFQESAFISPGPGEFAVGMCRLIQQPRTYDPDASLFAFV